MSHMNETQKRLPRFRRAAEAAGPFQFTKRDLRILSVVAEHRFIRSEWLVTLAGGSKQQALRRLSLLYHHGYLDRPRAQLDYFHKGGGTSIIYGLASRGAGRLRRDLNMPFECMDWKTRNCSVGRLFLEHTVLISDFMATQLAESRKEGSRLLSDDELEKPKGRELSKRPWRWSVRPCNGRQSTVVPDKVYAVERFQANDQLVRTHYLLEADRGTMPIERSNRRQTSIMGKLRTYSLLDSTGSLPPNSFVVILSESEERLNNIVQAIAEARLPRRLFKIAPRDGMKLATPRWHE